MKINRASVPPDLNELLLVVRRLASEELRNNVHHAQLSQPIVMHLM